MSKGEAKEELQRTDNLSCGDNDISVYRYLRRQGYHWLKMATKAADLQNDYVRCQESLDIGESLLIKEAEDLRQPCLDFL